jgi:hypothetical protein
VGGVQAAAAAGHAGHRVPRRPQGQADHQRPVHRLLRVHPATRAQLNRSFEYAPDGLLSGLCLADLDNPNLVHPNGVVLRWCNGSPYQQWQASEANGNPRSLQWRNVASRGWIQANGTGKQLSTSTAAKRPAGAFWAWNTPAKAQG